MNPLAVGIPGPQELLIISGILVLLFGANRIPKMARGMGASIFEFKKGLRESREALDELQAPPEDSNA